MENCTFTDVTGPGYLPYPTNAYTLSRDVEIKSCTFTRCGSTSGVGIIVTNVNDLLFYQNQFIDCGDGSGGSSALYFSTGDSYYIKINNNIFSSPTGKTSIAIKKGPSYVFHPETNEFNSNILNGLPSQFEPTS
jgi:hypothetical protein